MNVVSVNKLGRLATRVAEASGVDINTVDTIFASYGVPAAPVAAAPRNLRVLRIRLWGEKRDIPEGGLFDTTLNFPTGLVMAVAPNLKGKTSVLELITWCLRGTPKALQQDVLMWLDGVECDVIVNNVPHGIRMRLSDGVIADAAIIQANSIEVLADARGHSPANARVIARAGSNAEYDEEIQAFMLARLGLEPILAYVAKTGTVQTHAWPSYFGAIYPPAGGEKVLIGETMFAGLAGRLLEVFLDLPGAALLTRVKAARDRLAAEDFKQTEQMQSTANIDRLRDEEQQERLDKAKLALVKLAADSKALPSMTDTAKRVASLSLRLTDAEADRRGTDSRCRQVKANRQADERRLNNMRESAVARQLFHGLDPQTCPRCETPVTTERRSAEVDHHRCAVCTSSISVDESADDEELVGELSSVLEASRQAEREVQSELAEANSIVEQLVADLAAAEVQLRDAQQATSAADRFELEQEIARAEGALEMLRQPATRATVDGAGDDTELRVLRSLADVLEVDLKAASVGLFAELGPEIAEIAKRFGIASVQDIKIDRRAALRISKGGAKPDSFSSQSPGERLRLRIATIIALLRVGARLGIATHPGLLMLDSLRAEEVQDDDAHAIVDELVGLAAQTPGLQMITTTADMTLPLGRLPEGSVLAPPEGHDALW